MAITRKDVDKVADLARLALTEEELELSTKQLQRILGYVEKLSELDTNGVEPTSYTVPLTKVFRQDKVRESLAQDDALSNSAGKAEGYFKVPKIID